MKLLQESRAKDALFKSDFRLWNCIYALISVILILPIVYDVRRRKAFIYHGKFLVYNLYLTITAAFIDWIFVFRMRDVRNGWIAADVMNTVSWFLGIKWELRDTKNIVKGSAMVIGNHQSSLDVLCLFAIWRALGKCAVVAKKEILYYGPFGLCAWLCGVIFIDRKRPSKAYETLKRSSRLIQQEIKLLIFPEGTRNSKANQTGKLLPFKRGAFVTAISNKIPIVPFVTSPYYFVNTEEKHFGQGKMIIRVLPPIPTTDLTENDVNDLMSKAHDVMSKAYEELFEEVVSTLPEDNYMRKTKIF